MDKAAAIKQFCELTSSADPAVAKHLLESCKWDTEAAVNMYFEGGSELATSSGTTPPSSRWDDNAPKSSSRGELSRGGSGSQRADVEVEEVRAPIAARSERLLDEHERHANYLPGGAPARPRSRAPPGPFEQAVRVEALRDFRKEQQPSKRSGDVHDPAQPKRQRSLAELFRPPVDLLFAGTLEAARVAAQSEGRVVLVNVQRASEFASQQLNRDTWADERVRALVKKRCLLLQLPDSAPEGARFVAHYQVRTVPHVALLDPLTGERLAHWDGFVAPDRLVTELSRTLERLAAATSASASVSTRALAPAPSLLDLSEEDQLQAALAASLYGAGAAPTPAPARTKPPTSMSTTTPAPAASHPVAAAAAVPDVQASAAASDDGVQAGEEGLDLLVRLPGGAVLRGRFAPDSSVERIAAWVGARAGGSALPTRWTLANAYPRRVFDDRSASLRSLGLVRSATLWLHDLS